MTGRGGMRFHNGLRLIKRLVNLLNAKLLARHPASTVHREVSAEEHERAGVIPEMIRLSVRVSTSMTFSPTSIRPCELSMALMGAEERERR